MGKKGRKTAAAVNIHKYIGKEHIAQIFLSVFCYLIVQSFDICLYSKSNSSNVGSTRIKPNRKKNTREEVNKQITHIDWA